MDPMGLLFIIELGIYITVLTLLAAAVVALLPRLPRIAAWIQEQKDRRKLRAEAKDRKKTDDWNRLHPSFGDEDELR